MHLTPSDTDKLLLSVAATVARDRRARRVKLNEPEAVALLCAGAVRHVLSRGQPVVIDGALQARLGHCRFIGRQATRTLV